MRKIFTGIVILICIATVAAAAPARGTAAEARAMLERAAALKVDPVAAIAEFNKAG